jgi:CRP/FNR family transcriptional regulator, cyclic AMP receptor protein
VSIFGWIAAGLVLSSFYLKTMVPLRLVAMCSNVMFIIYAVLSDAPPILVLHCLLFPLNLWRLLEARNLRHKFAEATQVEISPAMLLPFMQKYTSRQGDAIFQKGDNADKVYLVLRGQVLLQDSEHPLADGQLFGLLGVFSNERRHTDSASCLTEVEYGVIDSEKFLEFVHQEASFENYVIGIIVQRHLMPG